MLTCFISGEILAAKPVRTSEPARRLNLAVAWSRSKRVNCFIGNVEQKASFPTMNCDEVFEHEDFDGKEICISVTLIKSPTTL